MARWDYVFAYEDATSRMREVVTRHKNEKHVWKKRTEEGERLALKLTEGENCFGSSKFRCLVTYLLWDQRERMRQAYQRGWFKMGKIVVKRRTQSKTSQR